MYATIFFYVVLSLLMATSMLVFLSKFCILEATDASSAALILDGGNIGPLGIGIAILRRRIKARLSRSMDPDVSLPINAHGLANTSHPPLEQGWGGAAEAAVSSAKGAIWYLEHSTGPNEVISLYSFVQSVTLLTLLRIFLQLPVTPANVQEVVWIIGRSWQTGSCWRAQDLTEDHFELRRLIKSSKNPYGIFALLLTTQRVVLSVVCLLEHPKEDVPFIRQARALLRSPNSSGSEAIQRVDKILHSHPPIQSVHGRLSLRLPLHQTYDVKFFIPVDILPLSACTVGPDGTCVSWIHKTALPDQSTCGGRAWLVRTAAIILSAIETELRQAGLVVDPGDGHNPEVWEGWVLRRLRVG